MAKSEIFANPPFIGINNFDKEISFVECDNYNLISIFKLGINFKWKEEIISSLLSNLKENYVVQKFDNISEKATFLSIIKLPLKYKYDKYEEKEFVDTVVKIGNFLTEIGAENFVLKEKEIWEFYNSYVNLAFDNKSIGNGYLQVENGKLKINNYAIKIYSIAEINDSLHQLENPEKFLKIENTEIFYFQTIWNKNQKREIQAINTSLSKEKLEPIEEDGEYSFIDCAFTIIVKCINLDEKDINEKIENNIYQYGLRLNEEDYNQVELFEACLLGNVNQFQDFDKIHTTIPKISRLII